MNALQQRRTRQGSSVNQVANVRKHKPDYWLLIIMLGLLSIGLIVVYSISPALGAETGTDGSQYVTKQLIGIAIGLVMFAVASKIPLHVWKTMYMPLLALAGFATLLTLMLPVNEDYPAHRWIRFGGFSFQSVELLKFAIIVWLSGFLVTRIKSGSVDNLKQTLYPLLGVLGVIAVVVAGLQSDLGSAAVIFATMVAMVFVAGLPVKRILMLLGILAIGALILIAPSPYRRDRISTFMNPQADCSAAGYQACQALIAVGSGGMAGLGLGNSVQAYGYLPEAENDSIFAIYAEKFGYIGSVLLLGLMLGLFARIKKIAERAPDDFSRLMVVGILVWLSTQAIINIGAMLGLLPLKGITLPLISYGGSSVLMVLAVLGVVFQVSRYTANNERMSQSNIGVRNDNSRNRGRVRRTYHTPISSRR
jgi:cell division protein FtsW